MMDELERYCQAQGLSLSPQVTKQFQFYGEVLLEWNQRVNLTRITEGEEVVIKHFIDSLTCLEVFALTERDRLLDVGSGAGFPGLPLRLLCQTSTTLLDSSQKKVEFLRYVCKRLGLEDVEVIHGRAEELGKKEGYRESFTLVTARAVAGLPVLAELCLPFVAPGGVFLAQKGPQGREELKEGEKAIGILGGEVEEVKDIRLPRDGGARTLIAIRKIGKTPGSYPRRAGIPGKRPLGK